MDQIRTDKVVMKPRIYFIAGSILAGVGLITAVISSVFLLSLARFLFRAHGPMAQYRLDMIVASFPLWIPLLAGISLIGGIILLRQYDFSYKKNFWLITTVFVASVLAAVLLIDASGLNDLWFRKGPMKGILRNYLPDTIRNSDTPGYNRMKGNGWRLK